MLSISHAVASCAIAGSRTSTSAGLAHTSCPACAAEPDPPRQPTQAAGRPIIKASAIARAVLQRRDDVGVGLLRAMCLSFGSSADLWRRPYVLHNEHTSMVL